MNEFLLLPRRDGELILAIRSQCPEDLLPDLHEYLLKHRPRAAKPQRYGAWTGICLYENNQILIDPDCRQLLKIYLHELAHAGIGTRHGHNEHFAVAVEALYIRFRVTYTTSDLLYNVHEMHEYYATGEPALSRAFAAKTLAQSPLTVEKLEELGQNADAAADAAEWRSVLVPLFYVLLFTVPILLYWLVKDYLPAFIRSQPEAWLGLGICSAFVLKFLVWDWIRARD